MTSSDIVQIAKLIAGALCGGEGYIRQATRAHAVQLGIKAIEHLADETGPADKMLAARGSVEEPAVSAEDIAGLEAVTMILLKSPLIHQIDALDGRTEIIFRDIRGNEDRFAVTVRYVKWTKL